MLKETLTELFTRELNILIAEINLYKEEKDLWIIEDGITNSAGNLCLHLIGNLNHFIGALLGNTGYIRHREDEFNQKNIPRTELITGIEQTMVMVKNTLSDMSAEDLEMDFPIERQGKIIKNSYMLLHLLLHFNYHLGQINYHRRLVEKGTIPIPEKQERVISS